jgi:hypothetical protein
MQAQWSSDPLVNLGVAVAMGEQVVPKMAATSDSGCYIAWFDSRNGGYAVYLQRLNAAGFPQWAANGLLISNHPQSSSLVDWDMKVDPSDNALLAFTDTRSGGTNQLDVFAYKISPAGAFLWGADGIGLSPAVNNYAEYNPKIAATAAGNVVIGWIKGTTPGTICFQRLSGAGVKMWGVDGITMAGATGHTLTSPDLVPADSDNVIALWKNNTGSALYPVTVLYTQKISPTGSPLWTPQGGVVIYDQGHISAWTYPQILSDAGGGAYYCWYDSPSLSSFNVSVAHVSTAGILVFPLNGVLASTNTTRLHMSPSMAYVPANGGLYAFWQEEDFNQTQYGIYGQKFSPAGARLWTDNGQEFVPIGSSQISFVCSAPADTNVYVGYFEAPNVTSNAVKAFKATPGGAMSWGPVLLSSASLGSKDDLLMIANTQHRAFLCWSDGRNDFSDIYAQNVNPNGTLGNPGTTSLDVELTPSNPIQIEPQGGHFNFNISLTRWIGPPAPYSAWTRVKYPNGTYSTPLLGPVSINTPVGVTITRMRTQSIPGTWPAGVSVYLGYVNDTFTYPAIDSSSFIFTKLATVDEGGEWVSEAICSGELFPGEQSVTASLPSGLELGAYPNPFNPSTVASFELRVPSHVSLKVYDTSGRLVTTLVDGWRAAGTHEVTFDGSKLASGIYLAKLEAGGFAAVQKLVLLK